MLDTQGKLSRTAADDAERIPGLKALQAVALDSSFARFFCWTARSQATRHPRVSAQGPVGAHASKSSYPRLLVRVSTKPACRLVRSRARWPLGSCKGLGYAELSDAHLSARSPARERSFGILAGALPSSFSIGSEPISSPGANQAACNRLQALAGYGILAAVHCLIGCSHTGCSDTKSNSKACVLHQICKTIAKLLYGGVVCLWRQNCKTASPFWTT